MSLRAHVSAGSLATVLIGCGSPGSSGGLADGGSGFAGTGGLAGAAAVGGQGGTAGSTGGAAGGAGHTVSGTVNFVNAPAEASTTVILSEPSFQPMLPSSAAPGGFVATGVEGAWSIPGVPNGKYSVLVAYENDGLVSESSSFPSIEVAGGDALLGSAAKVTAALEIVGPEGSVPGSGLTFTWKSEASADYYEVMLYDQAGKLVWQGQALDSAGVSEVALPYQGPTLPSGSKYQFRVGAYAGGALPITRSEDLRGVFTLVDAP